MTKDELDEVIAQVKRTRVFAYWMGFAAGMPAGVTIWLFCQIFL